MCRADCDWTSRHPKKQDSLGVSGIFLGESPVGQQGAIWRPSCPAAIVDWSRCPYLRARGGLRDFIRFLSS